MMDDIERRFREVAPPTEYWSLRIVAEDSQRLSVERDVVQPPRSGHDSGAMVTVIDGGGLGYAATSDLSRSGLAEAGRRAAHWAHETAPLSCHAFSPPPASRGGVYASPVETAWEESPLGEKIDLLREHSALLRGGGRAGNPKIVDWSADLWRTRAVTRLVQSHSESIEQEFEILVPGLSVSANEGTETQTRTLKGHAVARQGGFEILEQIGFREAAQRLPAEALALLAAPDCPSGIMDVVLAPDQMILQLHESIGHPLELDRILGDERNYAGSSFVTPEMFGTYQYGSRLLDVTFDPTQPGELATYAFDDEGTAATREYLIREGKLLRGIGGAMSQERAHLPGIATARATSWNRPPIDRMANLNIEPGDRSLAELIGAVERGVYLETNSSWSIDDCRNKFQFSCERGQLILDGELRGVIKKPSYRGISATFWRSLSGVGDASTREILGTPYCGKGEPNQVIRVGHASPACSFAGVEVFGGE